MTDYHKILTGYQIVMLSYHKILI